jgi:hypothetical protein
MTSFLEKYVYKNRCQPFALVYPPNYNNTNEYKNVLLIDNTVKDAQIFANSANASTFPIIYSNTSTKTELLELLRTTFTNTIKTIERIGLVFTTSSSNKEMRVETFLDRKPFFINKESSSSSPYSENTDFLISVLKEFSVKNIDYLACNTLNSPNWVNYYTLLTKETCVVVGASNDKTGNIKYGGDWMMESTSQNIELIYFTKSIEYYTYLLDNPYIIFASGLNGPTGLVINGNYMYVMNGGNGTITQLNLIDGSIANLNWATGLNTPFGLVINENYMYVTNVENITITQLNLINGSIANENWATGLNGPTGLVINGNYMYVTNGGNGTITKLNLIDGSIATQNWATGLNLPSGLVINGDYIYVLNVLIGTITQLNLINGSIATQNWATGLNLPFGLVINGDYMYVTNAGNGTITQLNLIDGSTENWASGLNTPFGLVINGDYMYVTCTGDSTILRFNLSPTPPPPPFINICFPSGTPIQTDQGIIVIEKINPNIHTINKKPIVDITKTITSDKYLIGFKKNALGLNYPTENTRMTQEHKLLYGGKMCEARTFLSKFEKVIKVKYNGEILYNVLMEEHSQMRVNNLICETLHPENIVAKLYTKKSKYTNDERDKIVLLLKECIKKKDYKTYNRIIERC